MVVEWGVEEGILDVEYGPVSTSSTTFVGPRAEPGLSRAEEADTCYEYLT